MFLLVPAYPGCPGSKAVKRSLYIQHFVDGQWPVIQPVCVTGMWQAEMQRQLQKEREEQLRLMQHELQVDTHAHMHP